MVGLTTFSTILFDSKSIETSKRQLFGYVKNNVFLFFADFYREKEKYLPLPCSLAGNISGLC